MDTVPCRICGKATTCTGTELCHNCWEFTRRFDTFFKSKGGKRWVYEKVLLHTEKVQFCAVSGSPGCLGWPEMHDGPCVYIEEECTFCLCGGDDVYDGYLWHKENCPLYEEEPNAQHSTREPVEAG